MALTKEEHAARMRAGKAAAAEKRRQLAEKAQAALGEISAAEEAVPMKPIVHAEDMPAPRLVDRLVPDVPAKPIVHEGGTPAAEIVEPSDDELLPVEAMAHSATIDDFELFLAEQDEDVRRLLTVVELRVIYETEVKRAQEEKKAAARKAVQARALRHAKVSAGLLPPEAIEAQKRREWHSQRVKWTVNMPEAGSSGKVVDAGVRINGRLYAHGEEMTGTLDEYISYRSIEARAHENEQNFQGRGKLQKLRQTATGFINMKGASL